MATKSLLHVTVLLAAVAVTFAALPNGWKACSRSKSDYEDCLKKEILNAIKTLYNGDKKLNVLPLEPLRISSLEIPKRPGALNVDIHYKNIDINGLKAAKLTSIKNDWKTIEAQASLSKLVAIGDYKVDGQVLVLPIKGEGKFNYTFSDLIAEFKVQLKKISKGGKKYFQMEPFDVNLNPKHLDIHMTNLFNGDKALGDNMNVFLNENWDKILEDLKPGISQALGKALQNISNAVLANIPAEEIDIK